MISLFHQFWLNALNIFSRIKEYRANTYIVHDAPPTNIPKAVINFL